jgi:hypothetical protein
MRWTACRSNSAGCNFAARGPTGTAGWVVSLWRQLGLDSFWAQKLPRGREKVSWAQVLELLVVNRLVDPGSEFHLHREWFDHSAMDVLLDAAFVVAEKDRLYRLAGT